MQQVLTEDTGSEPAFPKAVSVRMFTLKVKEFLETPRGDDVSDLLRVGFLAAALRVFRARLWVARQNKASLIWI